MLWTWLLGRPTQPRRPEGLRRCVERVRGSGGVDRLPCHRMPRSRCRGRGGGPPATVLRLSVERPVGWSRLLAMECPALFSIQKYHAVAEAQTLALPAELLVVAREATHTHDPRAVRGVAVVAARWSGGRLDMQLCCHLPRPSASLAHHLYVYEETVPSRISAPVHAARSQTSKGCALCALPSGLPCPWGEGSRSRKRSQRPRRRRTSRARSMAIVDIAAGVHGRDRMLS